MDFLPLAPLITSLSKVVGLPHRCESERSKLPDLNFENHLWHLRTSKALGGSGECLWYHASCPSLEEMTLLALDRYRFVSWSSGRYRM
ncbi:hypothetical protein TNCV_3417441 [Trichonephila clavipes]|nr:hypothetical protein TNCV_3417441 [Trichonephila clavipes]